jgi:hypothetical protein
VLALDKGEQTKIADSLPDLKSGECWAFINDLKKPVRLKVPAKNSQHPDRRAVLAKGAEKRQAGAGHRLCRADDRQAGGEAEALPQRRVLASIGFWSSGRYRASPSRAQVAGVAGYSPSSGGFNNLLGPAEHGGAGHDSGGRDRVSLAAGAPHRRAEHGPGARRRCCRFSEQAGAKAGGRRARGRRRPHDARGLWERPPNIPPAAAASTT